jgi:hypothetical protein
MSSTAKWCLRTAVGVSLCASELAAALQGGTPLALLLLLLDLRYCCVLMISTGQSTGLKKLVMLVLFDRMIFNLAACLHTQAAP